MHNKFRKVLQQKTLTKFALKIQKVYKKNNNRNKKNL